MEKAALVFRIFEICQILKHFTGTFRQAQTLKLGGVRGLQCEEIFLRNGYFIL